MKYICDNCNIFKEIENADKTKTYECNDCNHPVYKGIKLAPLTKIEEGEAINVVDVSFLQIKGEKHRVAEIKKLARKIYSADSTLSPESAFERAEQFVTHAEGIGA